MDYFGGRKIIIRGAMNTVDVALCCTLLRSYSNDFLFDPERKPGRRNGVLWTTQEQSGGDPVYVYHTATTVVVVFTEKH